MYRLIGFRKFVSKKGINCCIVNLLCDYSFFDIQHGACGEKFKEVFLPEECHSLIDARVIGLECDLTYGPGMFNEPSVTGIVFHDKK